MNEFAIDYGKKTMRAKMLENKKRIANTGSTVKQNTIQ